jgi:hypothetical protein
MVAHVCNREVSTADRLQTSSFVHTAYGHCSQETEAVIQSAMAGRGMDRLVDIDAPTMKQSVAWELALRAIHIREVGALLMAIQLAVAPLARHLCYRCTVSALTVPHAPVQIANAEESLKAETNADVVRDVRVRLQPLRRRARLVYFPAYIVQYTFGEVLAETGERRPQHFMAVISGMGAWHRSELSNSS